MSFLSRFSTKSRRQSIPPPAPTASSPVLSTPPPLHLELPSPSFGLDPHSGTDSPDAKSVTSGTPSWVKLEGEEAQEERREREGREQKKMDRARLGLESGKVLIELCGNVIRERGSTSLGIFRPYRLAESTSQIRRLAVLYIAYALELDGHSSSSPVELDGVPKDLFGARGRPNAKKDAFIDELRFAGVHDVVAVLKWGLRHLVYPSNTTFSGSTAPLSFWTTYSASSSPRTYPTLLSALPGFSRDLLNSLLPLLASLSANSEASGLSPHKLCLTLGLYVFGLARREGGQWTTWEDVYSDWRAAGQVLEGVLKVWLREQKGLPKRLEEVRDGVGLSSESGRERTVRALVVEIESQGDWPLVAGFNDQESGKPGVRGVRRRDPLQVLNDAVELGGSDEAVEWKAVVDELQHSRGTPVELLSEETQRILRLLRLDSVNGSTASPKRRSSFTLPTSPSNQRGLDALAEEDGQSTHHRYATVGSPTRASQYASKSVGNLGLSSSSSASWNDFAATGFGSAPLDAADEFGLIKPAAIRSTSSSSVLVKGQRPRRPQQPPRSPSTGAASEFDGPPSFLAPKQKPTHRLVAVSFIQIDEDFADAYLDTLVDVGACGAWPSFVISELGSAFVDQAKSAHLLVSQKLVPFVAAAAPTRPKEASSSTSAGQPGLSRSGSIAESTMSRKWNRRMSSLFSTKSRSSGAGLALGGGEKGSGVAGMADFVPPTIISPPQSPTRLLTKKKSSSSSTRKSTPPPVPSIPAVLPEPRPSEDAHTPSPTSPPLSPKKRRLSLSKKLSRSSMKSDSTVSDVPAVPVIPKEFEGTPSSPLSTPRDEVKTLHEEPTVLVQAREEKPLPPTAPSSPIVHREEKPLPLPGPSSPDLPSSPELKSQVPPSPSPSSEPTKKKSPPSSPIDLFSSGAAAIGLPVLGKALFGSKTSKPAPSPELPPTAVAESFYSHDRDASTATDHSFPESMFVEQKMVDEKLPEAESGKEKGLDGLAETEKTPLDEETVAMPRAEKPVDEVKADQHFEPSHYVESGKVEIEKVKAPEAVSSHKLDDPTDSPAVDQLSTASQQTSTLPNIGPPPLQNLRSESEPPSFEITQPSEDTGDDPAKHVPEHRVSLATLRRPEEDNTAVGSNRDSYRSSTPERDDDLDTVVISHAARASTGSEVAVVPSTPVRTAVLETGAPLSPTLSASSSIGSTIGPGSPISVMSSGSPTSQSSKKFLGSKKIGGFLSRNRNGAEKQTKADEAQREVSEREAKELAEKQLREVQRLEKEERKKPSPKPVSSVKKRVQEIEEEAQIERPRSVVVPGVDATPTKPLRVTTPDVSTPSPSEPLREETDHLSAKHPSHLDDLPSPPVTPTPMASAAAERQLEMPVVNTAHSTELPATPDPAPSSSPSEMALPLVPTPLHSGPLPDALPMVSPVDVLPNTEAAEATAPINVGSQEGFFDAPVEHDAVNDVPSSDVHGTKEHDDPMLRAHQSTHSLAETTSSFATADSANYSTAGSAASG